MKSHAAPFLALILTLALPARAAVSAAPDKSPSVGTVIVGDHEAPVGMVIAPWQDEKASDIDWPPRLLQETSAPLEPDTLKRRMQLEAARAAWKRARTQQQ